MIDKAICQKALELASGAREHWTKVAELIPKGEYYRYVPPSSCSVISAVSLRRGQSRFARLTSPSSRYQFALGPPARSLVTSISLARFMTHDELVPAFTCGSLMGRES